MRAVGFLTKVVMVIIIVLSAISYASYLQTGRFWIPKVAMSSFDVVWPFSESSPTMQPLESPQEDVYKWREQGQWMYGPNPPEGVEAQRVSDT